MSAPRFVVTVLPSPSTKSVTGTLSHAAIVSREMKIPCVVGVGNATEVLQTGDVVEVDAGKGAVRVLAREKR